MKTIKVLAVLIAFAVIGAAPEAVHAKAERLALKNPETKLQEKIARNNLKQIDLSGIEDPETRMAIREILRYLKLKHKRQ